MSKRPVFSPHIGGTAGAIFNVLDYEFRDPVLVEIRSKNTKVIFYVRRIGLYLYKYRINDTISIYILKGLAFVYQLM